MSEPTDPDSSLPSAENPEREDTGADPLAQRVIARDSAALAEYIQLHQGRLAGFVRSITGEHLLAVVEVDDLVQEIATTAIAGLPGAPLDQYSPMQWLQQIARRRVVDAHRFHFDAQRRDANRNRSLQEGASGGAADEANPGLEKLLAASMTSPSAALSRDVRMIRLQEAIASLSGDQQQAVRMRYAEGMSTKVIAEKLGKTDVAVRVLLSRCMRQLEQRLEDVRPDRH